MDHIKTISIVLMVVGAINWGLVGLMDLDLVVTIFGEGTQLTKIVYILVGLSGLYHLNLVKDALGISK